MSISCFGRSPWVLKELLSEARLDYMKKDKNNTLIYRGTCKGISSEPTWQRCLARPSRPLSTVVLSEEKKKRLLEDVEDYLAPSTRRWYSNRGIPYRRGYLLYGPPGTGKSSLSLALAGHFKMRIYIVSLNSISSSEENLSNLFADLPRRCVVLLEDIDTAGLTNTREAPAPAIEPAKEKKPHPPGKPDTPDAPDKMEKPSDPLGRLSLSGLLNILDGVASQEGRLLIMTTNHLENLDAALIRPGRVDMTIEFSRADSNIASSIFSAIYTKMEGDEDERPGSRSGPEGKQDLDQDEIERLAHKFAAQVPADELSPAEIQGYLLRHKRSPREAVSNIGPWVLEMRKQKKEKTGAQAEQVTFAEKKEEPTVEESTPGLGSDTPSSGVSVASEPRTPADFGLDLTSTKGEEGDGEAMVVVN
ncbi:AAA family ATPase [Candidatus Bathyarchaeota archaeon]|nr:AAA family ATPase [Candidatus Bathyarchaeota archaeon]